MSIKRRRNEIDIMSTSDEKIVDFLDRDPYLFRSIQALLYLENNQLPIVESTDPKIIFEQVTRYIKLIFDKFFVFDSHRIDYSQFNSHESSESDYFNYSANQKEEKVMRKRFDFSIDLGFKDLEDYYHNMSFILSRLDNIFNNYLKDMTRIINNVNTHEKVKLDCSMGVDSIILIEMQWVNSN